MTTLAESLAENLNIMDVAVRCPQGDDWGIKCYQLDREKAYQLLCETADKVWEDRNCDGKSHQMGSRYMRKGTENYDLAMEILDWRVINLS